MTPNQINIAIAESLGICRGINGYMEPCFYKGREEVIIPNYHGSLDACVEFEKALSLNNKRRYYNQIMDITMCGDVLLRAFRVVTPSAPQRCEAYLKTIGKWID